MSHRASGSERVNRDEVEGRCGNRKIAETGVVPGQKEDVWNLEGGRAEQIALQRDSVTVATLQLHNGLDAFLHGDQTASPARHADHRALTVCDVSRVDPVAQEPGFATNRRDVG